MYIDVIIPNFDESGEDVLISTWYKKVGDKISNGEVIAEAETSTIACGITSGYDCFLSKIIAKEGETVPQGSKVAVIEVNVEKPTGIETENIREEAEEELKNIKVSPEAEEKAREIEEEKQAANKINQEENKFEETEEKLKQEALQKEAAASRAERRRALMDMQSGKISADEIERRRARREALQNIEQAVQREIIKEEIEEREENGDYSLSVSSKNHSNDLVANSIDDVIDEGDVFKDDSLVADDPMEIDEIEPFVVEEEKKASEREDTVVSAFAEQAEQKFKSILRDAEAQAKAEADKMREKIMEDAKATAIAESAVMKAKILREYENKASKDASEMHKKIVQGSISEAQNTKTKLIEEAKAEAIKEAEALKVKIKEDAQKNAEQEAEIIKQNSLKNAEREAKEEADKISKEIIEKAITESKLEANEIKKDIIKSAGKHAKKESELLIKDELRRAKKESQQKSEEIITSAILASKQNAREIKEEILDKTKAGVQEVMDNMLKSVIADGQQAISQAEEIKAKIAEGMKESIDQAESAKEKIVDEINRSHAKIMAEINESKDKAISGLKESIDQAVSTKEKLSEEIQNQLKEVTSAKEKLVEEVKNNIDQVTNVKEKLVKEINESKERLVSGVKESIDNATNAKNNLSQEIKNDIDRMIEKKKEINEEIKECIDSAISEKKKIDRDIRESIDQTLALKSNILEDMKLRFSRIFDDISQHTRETLAGIKSEILRDADERIRKIKDSCHARDLAEEIIEERINAKQDEIVEKLISTEQKLDELKDIEEKRINEEARKRENTEEITKNLIDAEQKLEEDIQEKEILDENLKAKEDEIVEKLMNIQVEDGGTPEMYANNWNKPKFFYSPDDKKENIDFLKQKISKKMKDTYDSSVIATISNEVDMSAIISLEKAFGEAFSKKYNTRLGFTPFFIMASVGALKRYKVFNAHIHGDEIIYKNHFDISVITCGNDGIYAPVIREADKLNFAEIERRMISLSRRAVEGTLSIEEVSDGTFTVVNAGAYGSLMGTDILTPPQVATLSVHKMHKKPVATKEGVEVKPMLYVSLSYDHRIADTKLATEFLDHIKNYVENPGWQLLGL